MLLIGLVLGLKLLVFLTAVCAETYSTPNIAGYFEDYHHLREDPRFAGTGKSSLWELFSAGDAQWYASIAETGYPASDQFTTEGCRNQLRLTTQCENYLAWAFFPGWPMLMHRLMAILGGPFAAGFLAANILSLAAAVVLYLYLRGSHDETTSMVAVLLLCASPFSVFLDAPFTESLFLLLTAGIFFALERRSWAIAGICFALLAITRPNGIFVVIVPLVAIVGEMADRRHFSWRQLSRALWLGLAALPYGLWLWYNSAKTGDPFFFYTVQQRWFAGEWGLDNLLSNLGELFHLPELSWHAFHSSRIDVLVMAVSILILAAGVRRLKVFEAVYAGVILVVPLISKDLMSYSRYAIAAWPLFLIISAWCRNRRWLVIPVLALSVIGQLLLAVRIVHWDWVG